jgi:site-specific recombinase XerC
LQELPASTDAFVWLRLYQVEMAELIPQGRRQPLWWMLRRPARPLTYHAVYRMFERVNQQAGTSATLHSLRHTAAYRMAEDPALPLTDVQFVLGHAQLTTTQIYLTQLSGIASGEKETAGRQVNVAPEWRLRSVRDSCPTRAGRHVIPSDARYAR